MNKKIISPIIAGIAIAIISTAFLIPEEQTEKPITLQSGYQETNDLLKSTLAMHQIAMSSPLKLNGDLIDQYCSFFADSQIQDKIEYCTSTELKDSQGNFLGNIHMIGTKEAPQYVIGVIQTNPFVTQLDDIKIVYQSMIDSSVCNCWGDEKPGGFESVSEWVEAAKAHHLEAERITSKSEVNNLANKDLLLEITTNTEGYLWKLIITM